MGAIISFLLKLGFGGVVDKGIAHLERRAELANDREALRLKTTAELAREAVKETWIMADYNKAKMNFSGFWVLVLAVSAPFVLWLWAVVLDSLPYAHMLFGDQQVANLPTPALQEAFARMIEWTFYVGSSGAVGVSVAKAWRK